MYPPGYGQMGGSNNPSTNPYYPYMMPGYMPPQYGSGKSNKRSSVEPTQQQGDKPAQISNEEVMSSIMELKSFIFDSNSRGKQKNRKGDDSSSDSYHRHRRREKYRRGQRRRRDPTPSEDENASDESPAFSFNKQ